MDIINRPIISKNSWKIESRWHGTDWKGREETHFLEKGRTALLVTALEKLQALSQWMQRDRTGQGTIVGVITKRKTDLKLKPENCSLKRQSSTSMGPWWQHWAWEKRRVNRVCGRTALPWNEIYFIPRVNRVCECTALPWNEIYFMLKHHTSRQSSPSSGCLGSAHPYTPEGNLTRHLPLMHSDATASLT